MILSSPLVDLIHDIFIAMPYTPGSTSVYGDFVFVDTDDFIPSDSDDFDIEKG